MHATEMKATNNAQRSVGFWDGRFEIPAGTQQTKQSAGVLLILYGIVETVKRMGTPSVLSWPLLCDPDKLLHDGIDIAVGVAQQPLAI